MKILTFGEVMLRFAPQGNLMLRQSLPGTLNSTFGGAEANVACGVANLGGNAVYITALPDNQIGKACAAQIRGFGVDTSKIAFKKGGRMGVYYLESGSNQRASKVVYDRADSSVSKTAFEDYDFDAALEGATRVHISGITPALSEICANATLKLVRLASKKGVKVSCDLNFRNKLWNWKNGVSPRDLAREIMPPILENVDLIVGNEEDAFDVLGIRSGESDVKSGKLDRSAYIDTARQVAQKFSSVKKVSFTLRESLSASHNNWGAMLFDAETQNAVFAPERNGEYAPYQIKNIVDRVGGGDSFATGLIYALECGEFSSDSEILEFAVANSCLCHTIVGDYNYVEKSDVLALMNGGGAGRIQR